MKQAYEILLLGRKEYTKAIDDEIDRQGHTLTGNLKRSQTAEVEISVNNTIIKGLIANYGVILDKGVKPARASFKQFPFLVEYFKQRGYDDGTAKGYAAATIKKWMKEGMSTNTSRRFSRSRERQYFLRIALRKAAKKANVIITKAFSEEFKNIFAGIKKTETI